MSLDTRGVQIANASKNPDDEQWMMVTPAGLEPAAYSLGNCRSIQMS